MVFDYISTVGFSNEMVGKYGSDFMLASDQEIKVAPSFLIINHETKKNSSNELCIFINLSYDIQEDRNGAMN